MKARTVTKTTCYPGVASHTGDDLCEADAVEGRLPSWATIALRGRAQSPSRTVAIPAHKG
jgi:hypothetical protein